MASGLFTVVQPHFPLADGVISHAITPLMFLQIMNHYGINLNDADIVTRYFHCDQILELNKNLDKTCYVDHIQSNLVNGVLEILTVKRINLSVMSFPINNYYHHERQSIVYTKHIGSEITLRLEILINGIIDPKQRLKQIPALIASMEQGSSVTDITEGLEESELEESEGEELEELEGEGTLQCISLSFQLIVDPKKYSDAVKEIEILARYCRGDFISK